MREFGWALLAGVVAAAVWTAFVFAFQRWRRGQALDRFVGSYESYKKLRGDFLGSVVIQRDDDTLKVDFKAEGGGEIGGGITLSDRFPKTGRAVYGHRCTDGRLGWGTWGVQLADSG